MAKMGKSIAAAAARARAAQPQAAQVPLDVQNAMAIKRLEARLFAEAPCSPPSVKDQCEAASPRLMGGGSPSAGINTAKIPSNKNGIGEAANRVHDRVDRLHAVIDILVGRLDPVLTMGPPTSPTTAPATVAAPCQHMTVLETARERVDIAADRITNILDRLAI